MPKVSVIIPVYNAEKYLHRCLDSIINAQIAEIKNEIILIDDGSIDQSLNICKEYALRYSNVKVFSQLNQGPSVARNLGIEKSNGEYLTFVDSDDYVEKEYFQILNESINKFENQDILVFNYYRTSETKKSIHKPYENFNSILNHDDILELFKNTHDNWFLPFPVNKLYKKELLNKNKTLFDENMRIGEDTILNMKLFFQASSVVFIDKPIYNYYNNPHSVTNQLYKSDYLEAKELRFLKALEFYKSQPELNQKIYFEDLARANIERMYFDLLSNILVNKELNFIHEIKKLRNSELINFGFKHYPIRNVEGLKRKISLFLLKNRMFTLMKTLYKR